MTVCQRRRVPEDGSPTAATDAHACVAQAFGARANDQRTDAGRTNDQRANAGRGFARTALLAVLAIALLAAAFAWWFGSAWRATATEPAAAPDVRFTTIHGEVISLADLRGSVVLVDFWATTCTICMVKMPGIARLHERLSPRGLATIAVAMPYDRPDFVLDYANRHSPPFPIALDPMGRIVQALGPVRGTPTLILVDRAGRIVQRIEGDVDLAALERRIVRELEG